MTKKECDLEFNREIGTYGQEEIQFYVDDECLEIHTGNADGDSFLIILSPKEITQLIDFLNQYYKRRAKPDA